MDTLQAMSLRAGLDKQDELKKEAASRSERKRSWLAGPALPEHGVEKAGGEEGIR